MIDFERALDNGIAIHRKVGLNDVLSLANRDDVVSATDGRHTVVQDGPMRDSLNAAWHSDGLSQSKPPLLVLLYCEDEGRGDITTDLADSAAAFDRLEFEHQFVLKQTRRFYTSRSGAKTFEAPLIGIHPNLGTPSIDLCSRGWVRGTLDVTLEQVSLAMARMYASIEPVLVHEWQKGDCLIFDNVRCSSYYLI